MENEKKNFLLVDDDRIINILLQKIIDMDSTNNMILSDDRFEINSGSKLGYGINLDYEATIDSAINTVNTKGSEYDLFLIDYFIHNDTPETLIDLILLKYPDKPIVVLTSLRDYETMRMFRKMGVSDIIYKPFDVNTILFDLDHIIKSKPSQNIKKEKLPLLSFFKSDV